MDRHAMTLEGPVLELPGMSSIEPRRVEYAPGLALDVYAPPGGDRHAPAVVFVSGYPDPAFQQRLGCRLGEMAIYVGWARLVAASGMVAVTYANREPADVVAALQYIAENAPALGIDRGSLALWASSGNVPMALWLLIQRPVTGLSCAALCYGYMLDREGGTAVADTAAAVGFANPTADSTVDDVPGDVPLLIARAGGDAAPLNASIDHFVAAGLARDLPINLVNLPGAPHAFDMLEDSERSRQVIRHILTFLRERRSGTTDSTRSRSSR